MVELLDELFTLFMNNNKPLTKTEFNLSIKELSSSLENQFADFAVMMMREFAKLPTKEDYQRLTDKLEHVERNHDTRIDLLEDRTNVLKSTVEKNLKTKVVW